MTKERTRRGSVAGVGRAKQNEELGSFGRRTERIRRLSRIGVAFVTSGFESGDAAVSTGGALSGACAVGGVNSRHEPSVRPRLAPGSWGSPIRLASGSHVGAVWRGGASAASIATVGHRRCFGVVQRRRHYSFGRVDRSGRCVRLDPQPEVTRKRSRQSMASPSRRLAAHPKRRNLFTPIVSGQTHAGIRVTRSVRGERPERFTSHGRGFAIGGGHQAPLGGSLGGPGSSRTWSAAIAHSTDRPTTKWSRRASPSVQSCRRGARLILSVGQTGSSVPRSHSREGDVL